ncbi:MAG: ATP-binding cassette domain-containing protein [Planctomycetota bacterium]|nr:ATP-binding cassette domain-containing protein [Planctomycetota bacterium]
MLHDTCKELIRFKDVDFRFPHTRPSRPFILKDCSFGIRENQVVGLLGSNGAGKSTLLRLAAGIYGPTSGQVLRSVKIHPMFGVGTGFHNELTGYQNAILYGSYLGISTAEILNAMPNIIEFSGLDDAFGEPLYRYSRGMRARLGFSVVSELQPEFLILDEVFSGGDRDFREKSKRRMFELVEQCRGMFLASHNTALLRKVCTDLIWIEHGVLRAYGDASEVISQWENSAL